MKRMIAFLLLVCVPLLAAGYHITSGSVLPVKCNAGPKTVDAYLLLQPGSAVLYVCTDHGWSRASTLPRPGGTVAGSQASMSAASGLSVNRAAETKVRWQNTYEVVARDKAGNVKWIETIHNIVVTEGLNDVLTKYFKGSAYTAAWYVGLKGTGSIVAGDTAASHAGWSEVTAYSETNRPTLTLGTASGGSIDNSASKAVFTINANGTDVYGVFVISNNTKGGISGVLYGGANFGTARTGLQSGDTLTITITLTEATV